MISLLKIIASYCKNDIDEAEKILQELRDAALALPSGSESDDDKDEDYSSESSVESEDITEDLQEEVFKVVKDKEGHFKLM